MIKMYGPSVRNPDRIVNRDVPEADEVVYANLGYKRGTIEEEPLTKEEKAEDKAQAAADKVQAKADAAEAKKEAADTKKEAKKG